MAKWAEGMHKVSQLRLLLKMHLLTGYTEANEVVNDRSKFILQGMQKSKKSKKSLLNLVYRIYRMSFNC